MQCSSIFVSQPLEFLDNHNVKAKYHATVWTALEAHGFGCNLQHYNPLIDEKVATEWNVHPEWNLKGQLVFGSIKGPPKEKTYRPWEERISIHGTE